MLQASTCSRISNGSTPPLQPGKAMFQMMGAFAEFERRSTIPRKRVRAGLRRAKAEGKRLAANTS
jgi:DNA invertase Pin-like site-specific DNA recombinase